MSEPESDFVPFVPDEPLDEWVEKRCQSDFDNHFHMCGLYRGHTGPHRCAARVDNATWTDAEEDKGAFDPNL